MRECSMNKISESAKTFTLKAILVKPSQKVIAYVACENIAGVEVKGIASPKTDRSQYPVVTRSTVAPTSDDQPQLLQPPTQALPDPPSRSTKMKPKKPVAQLDTETEPSTSKTPKTFTVAKSPAVERAPELLPNGNYKCGESPSMNKVYRLLIYEDRSFLQRQRRLPTLVLQRRYS